MAKIGIFGGSFNPIHKGHLSLATQLKRQLHLDEVVLLPAHVPPHKQPVQLASDADRLQMCRLAVQGLEGFSVCDLESRLGGKSYTVDTLCELKKLRPDDELILIVGSDMLFTFDLWREYKKILQMAQLAAGARREEEFDAMLDKAKQLGGRVRICRVDALPMSSTVIRLRLAQHLSCREYLNGWVLGYINDHRLYQSPDSILSEIRPIAKRMLTKKRFRHTECVAAAAKKLAKLYGADEQRAELAGMLHDLMKNKDDNSLLHFLSEHGILLTPIEKRSPQLWHSIAGAVYCSRVLEIADAEIINAVRYHTTARAGMSTLEKIVYIADCISDDRDFDGVQQERKLARRNLDLALLHSLKHNISRLALSQKPLHPDTLAAYNELSAQTTEELE